MKKIMYLFLVLVLAVSAFASKNNVFYQTTGEDVSQYRLVKISSANVVYCDSGDDCVAIAAGSVSSGQLAECWCIDGSEYTVVGSKAIAAGSSLYAADDGKVSDVAIGKQIGILRTAIVADGRTGSAILWGPAGGNDRYSTEAYTYRFMDDFIVGSKEDGHKFSETADKSDWLVTVVDTGTDEGEVVKVADDGPGGLLDLTTNDAANDNLNLQLNGEAVKCATSKPVWFEIYLAVKDVSETDLFVGLAITDTDIFGGVTDRIGFEMDNDGNIDCIIEQDNTEYEQDSAQDISDCSAIGSFSTYALRLSFYWDGAGVVKFYVDGSLAQTFTDNGATILIPDDETLTPTVQIDAASAAAQTVWVDYVNVIGTR